MCRHLTIRHAFLAIKSLEFFKLLLLITASNAETARLVHFHAHFNGVRLRL
jgi:hypothetical protein